jgi:hypothetical protein
MSEKLLKDAGIHSLSNLSFQTSSGKKAFLEILQTVSLPNGIRNAQKRQASITAMRNLSEKDKGIWASLFTELGQAEDKIQKQKETKSDILKDTIGQITFQHEYFKQLNYVPFALMFVSCFKIFLVPAMAILTPFLTIFLPYIYLVYVTKMPLPFQHYIKLVTKMWFGSGEEGFNLRSATQGITLLFTFIQGILQPIQNAKHCATTDAFLLELGNDVSNIRRLYTNLKNSCIHHMIPFPFPKGFEDSFQTDTRQIAVSYLENSLQTDYILKRLGTLEVLFRISCEAEFHPVQFLKPSYSPSLTVSGLQDLTIPKESRILSSLNLSQHSHHTLLTGPNGGGKSSSMRAILQTVLFAQTFGYAAADEVTLRPFRWILSGLLLHDTPGKLSMFESEVFFAASLLHRKSGPGLVLFDELFHSTNPPDGIRTATCFLQNLWKHTNIASIVSTHVFELVEQAPESIQRLCVPGTKNLNGSFDFSYKLQRGICKLSSVERIWKTQGLCCG